MKHWWLLFVSNWTDWRIDKYVLGQAAHVSDDALHISAGLALVIVGGWLLRRPPWHWGPWLIMVAIETLNEGYDLSRPTGTPESDWASSAHDFVITLWWPTVVLLLFPRLARRYAAPPAADPPDQ